MSFRERFLLACRKEAVDCIPIWIMRQAGRYLPEYRALREKYSLQDLCKQPELACEVTLMPLRKFDFDAAILFSDLSTPFLGMGVEYELVEGFGPRIAEPLRNETQLKQLSSFDPEESLPFVFETIRLLRGELKVPLIGFTGAPFTMASYLIEGGGSRDYKQTRTLMYREPKIWDGLMKILTMHMQKYARSQVEAGAQAIQIFDSWVGVLGVESYRDFVLPYMQLLFKGLSDLDTPFIYFGTGNPCLLSLMKETGATVIGVDWRIPIGEAWKVLGDECAIQGNLDPALLFGSPEEIEKAAKQILSSMHGKPGYIFNLGHGVLPGTPLENVSLLVDLVHTFNP